MENGVFPCEWYVISLQVWQTWSHFSKWHIEWSFFTWTCSKSLYKCWIRNLAEIITLMRAGAVKDFSQWMGCFPMNAALTFARLYVSLDVYLIWSSCFVEYFQTKRKAMSRFPMHASHPARVENAAWAAERLHEGKVKILWNIWNFIKLEPRLALIFSLSYRKSHINFSI